MPAGGGRELGCSGTGIAFALILTMPEHRQTLSNSCQYNNMSEQSIDMAFTGRLHIRHGEKPGMQPLSPGAFSRPQGPACLHCHTGRVVCARELTPYRFH